MCNFLLELQYIQILHAIISVEFYIRSMWMASHKKCLVLWHLLMKVIQSWQVASLWGCVLNFLLFLVVFLLLLPACTDKNTVLVILFKETCIFHYLSANISCCHVLFNTTVAWSLQQPGSAVMHVAGLQFSLRWKTPRTFLP